MIETFIDAARRSGKDSNGRAPFDRGAPVHWALLTVDEVSETVHGGCVGLWAVGATEQHGPHLATGFDHLASGTIVERAAARLGAGAVVLPPLPFGCSDYWLELGGTLSLASTTMRGVLLDVARSAARAGLRSLVIVNGHSGNTGTGVAAVADLGATDVRVEFVSYWDLIDLDRLGAIQDIERGFGHAGEMETSIALELEALVRADEIPAPAGALDPSAPGGSEVVFHRAPQPAADSRRGVIGEAAAGRAELGAAILAMAVDGLVAHCEGLVGLTAAEAGEGRS